MTMSAPDDASYLDEKSVRDELSRVFDVCQGCRRCTHLCSSFPKLFEMVDRMTEPEAGRLTPAQQDEVVDRCFQCQLCAVDCPYAPGRHESDVDVPRLMLRAVAMRRTTGQMPIRRRISTNVVARTGAVRRVFGSPRGSVVRKALAEVTGVSAVRLLPPRTKQRFSTWFERRVGAPSGTPRGVVTVFPTCLVEYHEPQIGKDLVRVYERNGITCSNTRAGCCGAPFLHAGDIDRFRKISERNVEVLADEVRAGGDIVVPQPTCAVVIRRDYVTHVGGSDAELVAEHTFDAAEYLMRLHRAADAGLDTEFGGPVPELVTYHVACHLRVLGVGVPGSELLQLTGAEIELVQHCSGTDGVWGYRAENDALAIPVAQALGEQIERSDSDVVAGDCHRANTAIAEQTGIIARHPIQLIARAYGIPR